MTWHVDFDDSTIIYTDENGEEHDLNADGEPIVGHDEMVEFIDELAYLGAFSKDVADALCATL